MDGGHKMARWAERKVDSAEAEKLYSRPSLTACKHSEGSNNTQVELQPQHHRLDPASLYCLVTPSRVAQ